MCASKKSPHIAQGWEPALQKYQITKLSNLVHSPLTIVSAINWMMLVRFSNALFSQR